jgi:threonine/homoserine/homoserine lactone efflux protein
MLASVLAFAAFAALITIIPGLDTMLVVRAAALGGWRSGLAAGLGIGTGVLCWATASGLGITALLTASRVGYDVLRWLGAGYLCYLGVRALLRKPVELAAVSFAPSRGAFRTGLATNLLNPKIGVFYLSVLPQFIPHGVHPLLASVLLGLLHDVEGMIWFALLVLVVGRAAALLARPTVRRRLDQIAGLVFIGFGVRLAIEGVRRGP